MKNIWELREEMGSRQARALTSIFDAVTASSKIKLDLSEREAGLLSRQQMGLAWARARDEAVGEARDRALTEWYAAEEEYARKVQQRVEEILRKVFAPTRN